MSNWVNTLDLSDVWEKPDDNKMSMQELAGIIAKRLGKLNRELDFHLIEERNDIIREFKWFSEDK